VRCSTCGAEGAAGKRFCEDCGAPLGLPCASCGATIGVGKRFCGDCGTPVDQAVAEAASPAPAADDDHPVVAERRMCSVLFCDLVGFTALSEDRDPEEVRELLGRYFDIARTIVARYGGTVEKFIGDAVMAVWGTPIADENDAEHAVRAGLELTEAVAELGAEVDAVTLAARAGVVTGVVAVNLGASGQGMVVGDAVNTAARIQTAADPNTVLVDDGTRRAVGEAIAFVDAGIHPLKGKERALQLWRVDRVLAGVGGSQRVDGLEAPMVGRNAELRLVKELFHACAERRTPRLVSVVGAAGVGKSRLGWEFEKYVDGLADTVRWHRGRCLSYGDGVAFSALAEMVRQRFGIAEDEPPAVAGTKIREGLPSLLNDPAEIDWVEPRLGQLLGVDSASGTPALSRQELFAGWRLFFERISAEAPVILLIEDLHYADQGLFDFVEHLLEWARDAPIFVVTLSRPELQGRRDGWGSGRGNITVNLDPLDESAMGDLLDGLVPGMPSAAKDAVAGRAEGIPLYAVETVRMLIDRNAVQPVEGVYRLVGELGDLDVPASLHSLLAARLDTFDADARRFIADASVLGSSFSREALVAISGLSDPRVDEMLRRLVNREVLTVRADRLSPERGQYVFVQAMFREVAYETQSRRDRKARHLTVAKHLQETYAEGGEEIAEVIAAHLVDALVAVPDDADAAGLRQRAVDMLTIAGERAERTGAPTTAVSCFVKAVELLEQTSAKDQQLAAAGLRERAGRAATRADFPSALKHFEDAADIFRQHNRVRDAARADAEAGRVLYVLGRFEDARTMLRGALADLESEPDGDTVNAIDDLAHVEIFSRSSEGDALSANALELAQVLDLPDATFAKLLTTRSLWHTRSGRPVQAAAYLREAVLRAELAQDSAIAGRALLNLSDTLMASDALASSVAARAGRAQSRRIGDLFMLSGNLCNLIQALLLTGEWDEAAEVFETASTDDGLADNPSVAYGGTLLRAMRGDTAGARALLPILDQLVGSEDPQDQAQRQTSVATTAMLTGDYGTALAESRKTLALGVAMGIRSDPIRWSWPLAADAALAMNDIAAAREVVDWLDSQPWGMLPPILRANRARIWAQLLHRSGDPEAPQAFMTAVVALREIGSPYHLALGLLDQAESLAGRGEAPLAEALADEARVIAQRLGARPLVDRAGRLASGAEEARPEDAALPTLTGD
jgi:class 3 adenylate cyclase/tetratricopeptide (TPR) repeat protein